MRGFARWRDMIVLLGVKAKSVARGRYTLCSLAADLRVTQTRENGAKGIHCMIAKSVVHG